MMDIALQNASLIPQDGGTPITGERLKEMADRHTVAYNIIGRLARLIGQDVLAAIMDGVCLRLDSIENANESALQLSKSLNNPNTAVEVTRDSNGNPALAIKRTNYGNVHVTQIDRDFTEGNDYRLLEQAAADFKALIGSGATICRGEGDKKRQLTVRSFHQAMQWLREEAEKGVSKQRYKGLGEMNPEQLWETTMDPASRRMLRVRIEDAIEADRIFTTLMGEEVDPRRKFIESNALLAGNIDI